MDSSKHTAHTFRFRGEGNKFLGAGGYSLDHDDRRNLQYTGLYQGNEIVALLVTELESDSTERICATGDRIVRAVNSHDQLVAALQLAVRQNSCDMYLTGEELRKCEAALAAAGA